MRFEDRVKALFDSVVSHPAPDWERLVAQSEEEPAVKEEVRRLLEFHAKTTGFLSKPAVESFSSMVRSVGSRIGEFTLIREIGRGGMGIVYLAEDSVLGRTVALKILASQALSSEHDVARFRTEAKAAARLAHPGIVPVHRYGEQDGTHYIVMEFVEGETLADRLERLRRSGAQPGGPKGSSKEKSGAGRQKDDSRDLANKRHIQDVLRILSSVADALDYAHQNKVIHRDVKPSNILLTKQGEPRLTDFGVAKISTDQSITVTGEMAGTYYYMSPEQAKAQHANVDHRTDIFSLGVVLHECLTLRRPFTGESSQQVLQALTSTDPMPLRQLNPAVSRDLATVCHKALEKKPADRFPTAGHFAAELRCCLNGEPILTSPPSLWRRATKFVRKHRVGVVVALFALLSLLVVGLGYATWTAHQKTLGGITIRLGETSSSAAVFARSIDEAGRMVGETRRLGSTPLIGASLPPGLYRFSLIADSNSFAEFDDYLRRGESTERTVWIHRLDWADTGMIRLPAGEHAFVIERLRSGEPSSERIGLEGMFVDQFEVSNRDFKQFVDATGHPPPYVWPKSGYDPSWDELPVVGVSHGDALAYALWRGKRLPTISEWMVAAQLPDGRLYPWGSDAIPESIVPSPVVLREQQETSGRGAVEVFFRRARKVREGDDTRSPLGLYHMFGNVGELSGTIHPYSLVGGVPSAMVVVFARTDWLSDPAYSDLSDTGNHPLGSGSPRIGFRCVRSAHPTIVPGNTE